MNLEAPPGPALRVLRRLQTRGRAAWFVGGCVRDRVLGRAVNDWDIATDAPPEDVLAMFDKAIPTGLQHGTVTVLEGDLPVEVTTFRVEHGYTDGRRPDAVRFTREIEEDLARRDFTINALAWDPETGRLLDPFGGLADLAARTLRAVRDPHERFSEDGLRPLRAVRFASVLDLEIEPATWAAIPATLDTFRKVSAERIRVELVKLLGGPRPAWGVDRLRACGLLGAFLPEVADLGPELQVREARALERLSDVLTRITALLWPVAPDVAEGVLRRLRFSLAEIRTVVHRLGFASATPDLATDVEVRRFVAAVGPGDLDAVLATHAAWAPERAADWAAVEARIERLGARDGPHAARDLPVSGRDVMDRLALSPSRRVGRILDALLERTWADPSLGDRDRLLGVLEEVAREVP